MLCVQYLWFQNQEFQVYANDPVNSYVENGLLYLKPVSVIL